jgi:hypothetical protein
MLSEAALLVVFGGYTARGWAAMSAMSRLIFAWVMGATIVAWFYQLSGSEVIEFEAKGITIRKNVLGWDRVTQYRLEDCSALELHNKGEADAYGLQCKVGWRTVRFAEYVSEEQGNEIISALQSELPDVAAKLGASTSHFTTLNLSASVRR